MHPRCYPAVVPLFFLFFFFFLDDEFGQCVILFPTFNFFYYGGATHLDLKKRRCVSVHIF